MSSYIPCNYYTFQGNSFAQIQILAKSFAITDLCRFIESETFSHSGEASGLFTSTSRTNRIYYILKYIFTIHFYFSPIKSKFDM